MFSVLVAMAVAGAAPSAVAFDRSICADDSRREAFLKQYQGPEQLPALAAIKLAANQNEKRMSAKLDKLGERARWSAEQKADFAMELLNDPEFGRLVEESASTVKRILDRAHKLVEERDEAKQCLIVADMLDEVPRVGEGADRQWAAMDARVEAEAKKLGVTLN